MKDLKIYGLNLKIMFKKVLLMENLHIIIQK
jgi:hypothetical protein